MAATDLPGDEREAMGGHMDDYFGPRVTDAVAEGTYEHAWQAARAYYLAVGPNSYWAKAGLDYKRWLEGAERREHALREALKEISETFVLGKPMGADGKRLREIALAALSSESDGD